jgi:Uma2 family endonuclease
MAQPQDRQRRYNWRDYQSWSDEQRWEIIGGEVFSMSPSPGSRHQRILRELAHQMTAHFKGKRCEPFIAPMDVKLSDEDVVQPDILVVCDPNQVKPTHIEDAPALVVEILSMWSDIYERSRKLEAYARFGVKELWIVTPYPPLIEVFVLDVVTYRRHSGFEKVDELSSPSFPDLRLGLQPVFDFPPEPGDEPPIAVSEPPAPRYQPA